jgi:hypothetical protein
MAETNADDCQIIVDSSFELSPPPESTAAPSTTAKRSYTTPSPIPAPLAPERSVRKHLQPSFTRVSHVIMSLRSLYPMAKPQRDFVSA